MAIPIVRRPMDLFVSGRGQLHRSADPQRLHLAVEVAAFDAEQLRGAAAFHLTFDPDPTLRQLYPQR